MEESIHHNSSHFAAISDASPVQARVIEALPAEVNDGITSWPPTRCSLYTICCGIRPLRMPSG